MPQCRTGGHVAPARATNRRREGHSLATHERFHASEGDIIPCVTDASEMLESGVLGAIEVAIDADLRSVRVVIEGGNACRRVEGDLVLETLPR